MPASLPARAGGRPELGAREAGLATDASLELYLARQFLPWRRDGEGIVIAAADTSAANLAWLQDTYGGAQIASIDPRALDREIAQRFRDRLSDDAVFSLWSRMPRLSARRTLSRGQAVTFAAGGLAVAVVSCLRPMTAMQVLVAVMSAGFAISTTFRAVLALLGSRNKKDSAPWSTEGELPVYTVLVPLYREANILPQLAHALSALDYPRDRLDIKFVVEEDDRETRAAAEALKAQGPFEILPVPASLPRTKPKACNYALRFARGEYLVIYDAEDRPEPDQLRKAVESFRLAPPETVCLQARLTIDNTDDGWLARMFALDYAVWFKALLPGLDKLGVPMPLGGTSNHFRMAALRAAGGWDPFNVTEDADLGIRLAQLGYRVSMLDSTTFEEAPARLDSWLRQRSRWLKGYTQTWLVHARDPVALVRHVGWRGAGVLQLFLGGAIWSALFNPVLWLVFAVSCVCSTPYGDLNILGTLARISGLGLFTANMMLVGLAVSGERNKLAMVPYALCFTFYWALISVAAYRGLWQLVFKPFYWEKTPHGQVRTGSVPGV
ncbi:MAG TPA: glycosyltransferase [Rhizomicrobium sp.]